METTKNNLTPYEKDFFDKLRNYIDKPIYFYGSVQRDDYLPNCSDIDIDIFSNNVKSTMLLLENFLHNYNNDESRNSDKNDSKVQFKKIIFRMSKTDKVVFGYKGQYKDESNHLNVEIALYNEKDKEEVLQEHQRKFYFPFFITIILVFLKILHYYLGVLPFEYYDYLKNFLMNSYYKKADFIKLHF